MDMDGEQAAVAMLVRHLDHDVAGGHPAVDLLERLDCSSIRPVSASLVSLPWKLIFRGVSMAPSHLFTVYRERGMYGTVASD